MLVIDGVERRESYAVYSLARRTGKMSASAAARTTSIPVEQDSVMMAAGNFRPSLGFSLQL